eukprot:1142536-Rhodomonas_salina.2
MCASHVGGHAASIAGVRAPGAARLPSPPPSSSCSSSLSSLDRGCSPASPSTCLPSRKRYASCKHRTPHTQGVSTRAGRSCTLPCARGRSVDRSSTLSRQYASVDTERHACASHCTRCACSAQHCLALLPHIAWTASHQAHTNDDPPTRAD